MTLDMLAYGIVYISCDPMAFRLWLETYPCVSSLSHDFTRSPDVYMLEAFTCLCCLIRSLLFVSCLMIHCARFACAVCLCCCIFFSYDMYYGACAVLWMYILCLLVMRCYDLSEVGGIKSLANPNREVAFRVCIWVCVACVTRPEIKVYL